MIIYGFNNNGEPNFEQALAISGDGQFVSSHICSNESYMESDLQRHYKTFDKYFDHWKFEFIHSKDRDSHRGLQLALELSNSREDHFIYE